MNSVQCPFCESTEISLLEDEPSGELYCRKGYYAGQCIRCAMVFPVNKQEAASICGPESIEKTISEDTPCPNCGYSMMGLRIGQPCPECGNPIPSSHVARVAKVRRKRRLPRSVYLIIAGGGIGAIVLLRNWLTGMHAIIILGIASCAYGVHGLWQREIKMTAWAPGPLIRGAEAVFWGIAYVLFGLGLIVTTILIRLGVIR